MTKEDLAQEVVSLALALDDEFGLQADTVDTIADLLHLSHKEVAAFLQPEADFA